MTLVVWKKQAIFQCNLPIIILCSTNFLVENKFHQVPIFSTSFYGDFITKSSTKLQNNKKYFWFCNMVQLMSNIAITIGWPLQTILHVVLKAGYYNKLVVYGDESASTNIQTIRVLFSDDNLTVQAQMRSIINRYSFPASCLIITSSIIFY